ncbi:MAG: sulfotransferase [Gammaproteobacteria bacterium]|nr:sulfotransferase [Gammaproteobacteria bacterium]
MLLCNDDTEIVIEGFPRSANTFSVVAFMQAQSSPVKVAHHLHVEAQLMYAAKRGIPAIALIRTPEDSFRSLLIRHPESAPDWMIARYIKFYAAVRKLGDKCLVVKYEDVIGDMGGIISRINSHFGTKFDVPVHDETMVKSVFKEIEAINQRIYQGKESHIGRPSEERKQLAKEIDFSGLEAEISKANALYESMTSAC